MLATVPHRFGLLVAAPEPRDPDPRLPECHAQPGDGLHNGPEAWHVDDRATRRRRPQPGRAAIHRDEQRRPSPTGRDREGLRCRREGRGLVRALGRAFDPRDRTEVGSVEPVTRLRRELLRIERTAAQHLFHQRRRHVLGLPDQHPLLFFVSVEHDARHPVHILVHPPGEMVEQLEFQVGRTIELLDLREHLVEQVVGADVVGPAQRSRRNAVPREPDRILRGGGDRLDTIERDVVADHVQDGGDVALHARAQHVGQFGLAEIFDGRLDRRVHARDDLVGPPLHPLADHHHEFLHIGGTRVLRRSTASGVIAHCTRLPENSRAQCAITTPPTRSYTNVSPRRRPDMPHSLRQRKPTTASCSAGTTLLRHSGIAPRQYGHGRIDDRGKVGRRGDRIRVVTRRVECAMIWSKPACASCAAGPVQEVRVERLLARLPEHRRPAEAPGHLGATARRR